MTMLLSTIVLGERIGAREAIAASISFIGVVLVSNPELSLQAFISQSPAQTLGICLAFVASILVAISFVTIRYMGTRVSFMASVFSFGIAVTFLGWVMGGTKNLGALMSHPVGARLALLMCVSGFLGQSLISKGFQHCRAGVGSLLRNSDVPAAYFFAIIFLGEIPHPVSMLGSALVVTGTFIAGIGKLLAERKQNRG